MEKFSNKIRLSYNISQGILYFITKSGLNKIQATSGKSEFQNDPKAVDKKNKGPIPPGDYYIIPEELSDPYLLGDIGRILNIKTLLSKNWTNWSLADWGDWRVRLHRIKGKDLVATDRDNFFIHGGWFEGSAGCIDISGGILGNLMTDHLKDMLLSARGDKVLLTVTSYELIIPLLD